MTVSSSTSKVLTIDTINPHVRTMEYAVRGALPIRAEQLVRELRNKDNKLPFDKITFCNIGNPQQLGQKPLTFIRQVTALVEYTDLLKDENMELTKKMFPEDAIDRAKNILGWTNNAIGAYTESLGIHEIRESVAKFIEERDGFAADADSIGLTAGASVAVERILNLIISSSNVGIMIPIPQYPLYTATIAKLDAHAVPYYLRENKQWGLNAEELKQVLSEHKAKGIDVRALVVINPGNPTGSLLTKENMVDIVRFCEENKLVLIADEVYQANIYQPERRPFHSFKKIVRELDSSVELFSLHSISKGMIGECGRRGGYYETVNLDKDVSDQLYKMAAVSLCPNVTGQVAVEIMVNPPKKGEPSYNLYQQELNDIYESMRRRSIKLCDAFNALENITCNSAEGAMYLFPQIRFPKKAIQAAEELGKSPEFLYCMGLLESTGVCVVPGGGFHQEPGTFHFRSTFLPPEDQLDQFIERIKGFHDSFMDKYRD
ncbi:alanine transaminase [Mycoemilia scoparia]|uniref:Glutamate pyruvate transaminase n=1 Tax=Mycoemilia scoparia TaxID=417184 RepID=A0A9W7ZK75_9FUNG|nr:alanine transaminase [Mycoemilia scoparia]